MEDKTKEFVEKAKKVHGDKYDYSNVEYVNTNTKVPIICPIHGEFLQKPIKHINSKQGCPQCRGLRISHSKTSDKTEFIKKARKIHGNTYDYSKVEYTNSATKVCIICPTHGEFWQTPNKHLMNEACPQCNGGIRSNKNDFIKKATEIHGDKYDYSKVEYVNSQTIVNIICPIHGEFWQTPNKHIIRKNGCPYCKSSKLEQDIQKMLDENNIDYIYNKHYDWLKNLQLDFYIPDYNIAIECQGIQHFRPIDHWGGEDALKVLQERDSIKRQICEEKGIQLLYYSNLGIEYPYNVYEEKDTILNEIIKKKAVPQ